jgi:hypothetical protein
MEVAVAKFMVSIPIFGLDDKKPLRLIFKRCDFGIPAGLPIFPR